MKKVLFTGLFYASIGVFLCGATVIAQDNIFQEMDTADPRDDSGIPDLPPAFKASMNREQIAERYPIVKPFLSPMVQNVAKYAQEGDYVSLLHAYAILEAFRKDYEVIAISLL